MLTTIEAFSATANVLVFGLLCFNVWRSGRLWGHLVRLAGIVKEMLEERQVINKRIAEAEARIELLEEVIARFQPQFKTYRGSRDGRQG